MADRKLRYPLLWLLFALVMIAGAGLVSNQSGLWQTVGLALLGLPLLFFGLLALVYYLVERLRASRAAPKS